jgi:LVIVD repeat
MAAISALLILGGIPAATGGPSAGGLSTDNVEYVTFVPFEAGTATGARIVGKYLYVTTWKSISIYDISDAENPQLESITPIGFMFENEDVATNGKVLIFSEELPNETLHVWDVTNKAKPVEVGTLEDAGQHTMSCILNCKYLYGSDGHIIDLRNPKKPKLHPRSWGEGKPTDNGHDVNEIAPGIVLTASDPMQLLDARKDPTNPKLLAVAHPMDEFIHSVQWPNKGKDKFVLATGETWFPVLDTRCTEGTAGFSTWNGSNWKKTRSLQMIDVWRPTGGNYVDGSPPTNAPFGCSTHWFQQHPDFKNGGLVAAGFYNHGTRFLDVDSKGKIKEIGWFIPHGGGTSAAYWRTDRIVYAIDYQRGFDVLKFTGKF